MKSTLSRAIQVVALISAMALPTVAFPARVLGPLQAANVINGIRNGLAQRSLPADEIQMLTRLHAVANDMAGLYAGDNGDPVASQAIYEQNARAHMQAAHQIAASYYGNVPAKITMAQNAYILMSYDAFVRYNPDFYWARLGVFAANEVRSNLALAFSMKGALDALMAVDKTAAKIQVAGMSIESAAKMAGDATADLLQGQSNVLANIGALSILHKRYGAGAMAHATGLTQAARQGYALQQQADQARVDPLRAGEFHKLATAAAIQFGIHEQTYLLQAMWDQPNIKSLAQLNAWLLNQSLETLGLRGDIFIGTNKMVPFASPYLIIRSPVGATNLSTVADRIAIAKNGFLVLDNWNQNRTLSGFIQQAQTRLGNAQGLYQPVSVK